MWSNGGCETTLSVFNFRSLNFLVPSRGILLKVRIVHWKWSSKQLNSCSPSSHLRNPSRARATRLRTAQEALLSLDFLLSVLILVLVDCSLLLVLPLLFCMFPCLGKVGWGIETRDFWEYWERGAQERRKSWHQEVFKWWLTSVIGTRLDDTKGDATHEG